MKIGIIGTAGRGDDGSRLTPVLFKVAFVKVHEIIERTKAQSDGVHLVSGGAAFADHIAVQMADTLSCPLTLHLPAPFDTGRNLFIGSGPAARANELHNWFKHRCEVDSLSEIGQAIANGAEVVTTPGFKARNRRVAHDADMLIALTFGQQETLKPGGSADTMVNFLRAGKTDCWHVDLNTMIAYYPAKVLFLATYPSK